MVDQNTRSVLVKQMDGKIDEFNVQPNIKVADFRQLISQKTGVMPLHQRLIYKAKFLTCDQLLSEFIKEDGQTIHLIRKAEEPEPSAQPQPTSARLPNGMPVPPQMTQGHPFANIANMFPPGMNMGNLRGPNGEPMPNPMQMLQNLGINIGAQQPPSQSSGASGASQTRPSPAQPAAQASSTGQSTSGGQQASQGGQSRQQQNITINVQRNSQGAGASQTQPAAAAGQQQQIRINLPNQPGGVTVQTSSGGQPIRIQASTTQAQAQPQAQPTAQPTAAAPQQQRAAPASSSGSDLGGVTGGVIQLPHQQLFEIGVLCNRMMGANSQFPGPPMVQLPFERNPIHLLGSYLTNLSFNMQRLLPFMQRCGDLMQRESLMTAPNNRLKTAEMAVCIGEALEDLAKATGSVAHFYKNLELGPEPGQVRLELNSYEQIFKSIIDETGVIQNAASAQAARQTSAPATAHTRPPATTPTPPSQQPQRIYPQGQNPPQVPQPVPQPVVQQQQIQETQAASEQKKEEGKPFLEKMGEEFNQLEILSIMKGDVSAIPNFAKRIQKQLRQELPGGIDTTIGRKQFSARVVEIVKLLLHMPEQSRSSVHEEFDPVLIVNELVESHFLKIFNKLLDFEGDDSEFVTEFKDLSTQLIGLVVEEIEDGFIDGLNDLLPFLKANVTAFVKAACDPARAIMATVMGVPPIMKYIEEANLLYIQRKTRQQVQATAPTPVAVVVPEEEKKEEASSTVAVPKTREQIKKEFMERYAKTLEQDKTIIQAQLARPLSRAYKSLDLTANNDLAEGEEKAAKQVYQLERSQKAKTKPEFFKFKLREALVDCGRYRSAVVDEEMKKVDADEIPAELRAAYFDMLKAGVKARLASDRDYMKLKGTGKLEHLDKL